jgi:hypothetical protein
MKKTYTMFGVLFLALFLSTSVLAQNLLYEEFNSLTLGNLAGQNGWTAHSGAGTNPIKVTTPGLTYSCYQDTTTGNAITLQALSGEDCNKIFTAQSSGSVYASALINVTAATSSVGDYIFHLGTGTTTFTGKVFVRKNATTGFDFGLSKLGNSTTTTAAAPVWTPTGSPYSIGTTYLVVLKYTIVAGTTNDRVDLFINPDACITCAEPGTPTLTTTDGNLGTDPASLTAVYVRQGSSGLVPAAIIDGVRVAVAWCDLPLPVELSSFSSTLNGRNIQLNWETKTEKNSNKFVIEKKNSAVSGSDWVTVGSVKASVLSNSAKQYSFTDRNLQVGNYQYRLKMIDNDGSFTYSNTIETQVSAPRNFELSQNYPNPFNPSTKIDYQVPVDAKVILEVYNLTGQKVVELVNQNQTAGYYSVDFGSTKLSSGLYIYRLTASENATGNSFSSIKKMMMLK